MYSKKIRKSIAEKKKLRKIPVSFTTFTTMIDQGTVQQILDVAEVVDVVGEFVTLKRRGTNFTGLCPFHNEKTPSFSVSPAKGIYKCFGCGKGGGAVNFVMEHEHLSYVEALRWLAKKYNIEITESEESEEDVKARNDRESQMIVSAYAQKYFTDQLWEENSGRIIGLGYFRERGFNDDIVRKFELGFCPEGKDVFTQAALKQGYKMEFLEKTGLTIKRDDWLRDRFGGRVMFPIHGIAGRVIAFGGRTLSQDKKIAKYLNSPESEIYHKSRVLYGIFQSKRSIVNNDKCYLVEGYTDVISMHQAGIENVVASSGTSLTQDQIRLIRRFTNNITIIYDGDQAGIKASLRGIDMVLEEEINVKVLPLPEGEDPDSFAKSMSSSELESYIAKNETDFIKFKTRLLLKGTENDPVARAALTTDIVRSISVIPNGIVRAEYIKECSSLLKVREEVLYDEIRKLKFKRDEDTYKRDQRDRQRVAREVVSESIKEKPTEEINAFEVEEKEILRVLLKYGSQKVFEIENKEGEETDSISVAEYIIEELRIDNIQSVDPNIRIIFEEYEKHLEDEDFDAKRFFINYPQEEINRLASDIISEKYSEESVLKFEKKQGGHFETESELLYLIVPKILQEFKMKMVRHLRFQVNEKIRQAVIDNDIEKITKFQQEISKLSKVEKLLSSKLGNRTVIF
jgi:DNA primase